MSGIATAVVGGAIISGAMASNASKKASQTQANAANAASQAQLQAANNSNALNWTQYQQSLANQQPYQRGGQLAYSALLGGLGLGPATSTLGGYSGPGTLNTGSSTGGVQAPPGLSLTPGMATAQGFTNGQYVQPTGTDGAAQGYSTTVDGLGQIGVQNIGANNADATAAANEYQGAFTKQFTPSDLTIDPSYQWRLQQGQRALEASAAARGMTGSGQNLADITNYAQGAASQEYQNAFDRYNTQQTNLFNRLASLAGTGQTAANNSSTAGQNAGQMIGNTTTNAANASSGYLTSGAAAQAAGQVGSANAWGNAINSGVQNGVGWNWLQGQNANNAQANAAASNYNNGFSLSDVALN